jgi:polysaccharide biosynthesis/export protein
MIGQGAWRIWQGVPLRARHTRHICLLALVLAIAWPMLCARPVEASDVPQAPEVSKGTASADYRLAPGDRLTVSVFDQKELSGDFIVGGNGEILLPLIGSVSVAGLTLAEAQQLIQDRLADGVLVQPAVSVRIPEFRPIFVTGYVKKAGSYPFTFGLTVKAAIAAAGGVGEATEQLQSVGMSDFIMAEERVRQFETNQLGLLVRKSRLEAQREGRANFGMPLLVRFDSETIDFETIDLKEVKEVYASEDETFRRLVALHDGQLNTLQQQRPRIEAEIQAVNDEVATEKTRLDNVNEHLADLDLLFGKGLVRKDVLINQRIEKALVEAEQSRLEAQLAHLRQSMGDLDIKIEDVEASYERQILSELQDTSQRLREIEAVIDSARRIRDVRAEYANLQNSEPDYTILISRTRGSGTTTINATNETTLEAGDVVEVKRNLRSPGSLTVHSTESTSSVEGPSASMAEGLQPERR